MDHHCGWQSGLAGLTVDTCGLSSRENINKVLPYHNYSGSKYEALGMENCLPERLPEEDDLTQTRKLLLLR